MKNVRDLFAKKRDQYADIATASYVRPRGIGLHVVRLHGSGREVKVSSVAGNITFAPGDKVLIGSQSGRRNPSILGFPPAGLAGGGRVSGTEFTAPDSSLPQILAAHPDEVPAGSTDFRVVLVGRSFNASPVDVFRAIVWDETAGEWVADPLVTIHGPEYIPDPTTEGLELDPGEQAVAVLVDLDPSVAAAYKITPQGGRA